MIVLGRFAEFWDMPVSLPTRNKLGLDEIHFKFTSARGASHFALNGNLKNVLS